MLHGRRLLAQLLQPHHPTASLPQVKETIVTNLDEWEECEDDDPECEDVLVPRDMFEEDEDEVLGIKLFSIHLLCRIWPRSRLSTQSKANEYCRLCYFYFTCVVSKHRFA